MHPVLPCKYPRSVSPSIWFRDISFFKVNHESFAASPNTQGDARQATSVLSIHVKQTWDVVTENLLDPMEVLLKQLPSNLQNKQQIQQIQTIKIASRLA